MTEEQIALGRRAVACKRWRWMPGMKVIDSVRMTEGMLKFTHTSDLPDLTDPATLGCLLALVREAWSDPKVHVLYVEGLYRWECADRHDVHGSGATEAEALIDALEYA